MLAVADDIVYRHEIYLSNARRCKSEKPKTVIRHPVKRTEWERRRFHRSDKLFMAAKCRLPSCDWESCRQWCRRPGQRLPDTPSYSDDRITDGPDMLLFRCRNRVLSHNTHQRMGGVEFLQIGAFLHRQVEIHRLGSPLDVVQFRSAQPLER